MQKSHFSLIILLIVFSACNSSFQYNVHVKNSTGEQLKIDFKPLSGKNATKESTLLLENEEQFKIISTDEIVPSVGGNWTTAEHCNLVADYVNAYLPDGTQSKKKWCDKSIKFAVVDIGQGEFTIEYTKEDF